MKSQSSAAYFIQNPFELIKGFSSDVVAVGAIFIAIISYGLYRGKEGLMALLFSLYLGLTVYNSSAFLKSFVFFNENNTQIFFSKLIVYLAVVVLINLAIDRIISVSFVMSKIRNWFEVVALTAAITCSLVVIGFNSLSLSLAYNPSLLSASLLGSDITLFWTLGASILIMFLSSK
jgi:hypothetical protein